MQYRGVRRRNVPRTVGMRRVALVRVRRDAHGVHAEAIGTGHRLPTTRVISLATASRLAAQGVPLVVRGASDHDEGGAV